jgi:hypothetical protein
VTRAGEGAIEEVTEKQSKHQEQAGEMERVPGELERVASEMAEERKAEGRAEKQS